MVMDGVNFERSEKADTLALVKASPLTTATEMGTFCRFSARFCAVTTISWSCGPSSANAGSEAARKTARPPVAHSNARVADIIGFIPRLRAAALLVTVNYIGKATLSTIEKSFVQLQYAG